MAPVFESGSSLAAMAVLTEQGVASLSVAESRDSIRNSLRKGEADADAGAPAADGLLREESTGVALASAAGAAASGATTDVAPSTAGGEASKIATIDTAVGVVTASVPDPDPIPDAPDAPDAPVRRMLLVDDTPSILKVAGRLLKMNGFTVDTAENGAQSLHKAKAGYADGVYEFILSDLQVTTLIVRDFSSPVDKYSPVGGQFSWIVFVGVVSTA